MDADNLNPGEFTTPVVGISLYKNIFHTGNFVEILEKRCADPYSDLEWNWATTGDGRNNNRQSEYRSSLNCSLHPIMIDTDEEKEIYNIFVNNIRNKLRIPIINYQTQYRIDGATSEPYQVLKYGEGSSYRAHYDCGKSSFRNFSLVASLVEAEDGGELEFPFFDYKVKLSAGDVIIFPSNHPYTHIAHPVYSGIKYALVNWFA